MKYKNFQNSGLSTDKVTHHGYHRIYPWFLEHYKFKENLNLLEIGAHEMGSVKLWKDYFPNVELTVIDIEEKEMDGVNCVQLDQSKRKELEAFVENKENKFDVIIDDGSHVPEHQYLTISCLWKGLKPGGIYIIEDIETSYWGKSEIYGYKFNSNRFSIVVEFKRNIDLLNREFFKRKSSKKASLGNIISEAEMITFAYNCVIIVKKSSEFDLFYDREYKFKHKINELSVKNKIANLSNRIFNFFSRSEQ